MSLPRSEHPAKVFQRMTLVEKQFSVSRVYSWGRGDLGQLGLGDEGNHSHPTLIPNLAHKDILHIAASDFHSAFLTDDGELFTTGSNDAGQLGARVEELLQLFPVQVAALDMYTICHVACGQTHTVAVTDNGALASWGVSEFGQLGHKEMAGKVDAQQPRIVKGSRDHQFVRVACGSFHTLPLTGNGDVYSFGHGAFGVLGHDSEEDVTVPQLVDALWGLGNMVGWFVSFVHISLTMMGFGGGIGLGILAGYFIFIHFEPDDVKEPLMTNLSKLDDQGFQELLPEIPLWVKIPDYEKVDWLNKFVEEIWPYMNKAICEIIQEL